MLKTNQDRLVVQSVIGEVTSPKFRSPYRVSHDGRAMTLPGTGGITYNIRVGDPAFGWVADHVEPAVSISNRETKEPSGAENAGLNTLACIGNRATVVTGAAKGAVGTVTGKHGGIEHVLVDFDWKVLEQLVIGDKIQIRACGLGLALPAQPEIKLFNIDPALLQKLGCRMAGGTALEVPVACRIPAELMGSGLGSASVASGDYDITTADAEAIHRLGIDRLRFGDLVAIDNTDNRFGRCYRKGAVSVGVVVHSDCILAGHGPGVTTVMTSLAGRIKPRIERKANIAHYLGLRKDIFGTKR
ncbi:MAG: DUF4438 domain-containing protein [Candidatus Edwardsbacteria bacterium]|jgi:hypothetical protein|nr:DUF4438 domain-containing protein [Candidatus Edwardsbacteria bacterium]